MVKRVMKQRVAGVALVCCTVWLTSIVGASVPSVPSVPSGETTGFSNLRPSGPSSDQYTPLLRNPPNYERHQDAHGRGWMSDPPHPRITVRNQEEKSNSREIDSPPNYELLFRNRERYSTTDEPRRNDLKSDESDSELENAEAQRLSSIKLAFDDLTDLSEEIDGEEVWRRRAGTKGDGDMQRDEFLGDDTFEDEGPGSVEVYKLDLFKDTPVLSPRPARRNQSHHQRTKSKTPKKVSWKSMTTLTLEESEERKSNERKPKHIDESYAPSRSLKDRIFGTGGVPELQVGCEGVEGSQQRQKRSESKKTAKNDAPPAYTDVDYALDDYYDLIEGPEDPRYSAGSSRGDMNPKVKTPADVEARKILLKGQLPKRGDLGDAWEESLARTDRVATKMEVRAKRSPKLNHGEENNGVNRDKFKRRHRRQGRRNGRGGGGRGGGAGRKLRGSRDSVSRRRNVAELKSRREDRISPKKFRDTENRGEIFASNQPPYSESEKLRKIRDENERKLADYIRRNTPITLPKNPLRKTISNDAPAPVVFRDQRPGPDVYANERYNLLEQRRRMTEKINRSIFEEKLNKRGESIEIRPESARDKATFKQRSREEIERLNRLPIQSLIVIDMTNSSSVPRPNVESRFNNDVSDQSTPSPLVSGPSPCVWAIINCCSNNRRLTTCFEAKGCPGGHWDDPCTTERMSAALKIIRQHYHH